MKKREELETLNTTRSGGGFFAVDSRIWAKVTAYGMNEAVAYLVLTCGTGYGNRSTSWSTKAVMRYAGIGWERAKAAITRLIAGGFIRCAESHTETRPRYELATLQELVQAGKQPRGKSDLKIAEQLGQRGLLYRDAFGIYKLPEPVTEDSAGDSMWLPNAIVMGSSSGEESPVQRLRSAGCIWTLRLFVDLYAVQNLRDDGGISPHLIWQKFEREKIGQMGAYRIWAFKPSQRRLRRNGPFARHKLRAKVRPEDNSPIWVSLELLENMGLLSKNALRSGWGKAAEWQLKRKFLLDMVRAEFEAILEVYQLHRVPFTMTRSQRILEEAKQSLIGKFRSALTQSANGMSDVKIPISETSRLAGQLQSGNFSLLRDFTIELERRRLAWEKEAALTAGYNKDLAIRVLEQLRAIFPRQSNSGELMAQLSPGAPYYELLTVLDALLKQGLVTGRPLRGNGELHDAAALEISATGREWLRHRDRPNSSPAPSAGHVIHGDQIINYGNVGAIGRGATGSQTIFDQSWRQLQTEVDLQALSAQFATLRTELRRTAVSREGDAQLGALAEAEAEAAKGNGARVLEILSGIGKSVLETAKQIGVELVVKLILVSHGIPIS